VSQLYEVSSNVQFDPISPARCVTTPSHSSSFTPKKIKHQLRCLPMYSPRSRYSWMIYRTSAIHGHGIYTADRSRSHSSSRLPRFTTRNHDRHNVQLWSHSISNLKTVKAPSCYTPLVTGHAQMRSGYIWSTTLNFNCTRMV
jgi:hypothetical protein